MPKARIWTKVNQTLSLWFLTERNLLKRAERLQRVVSSSRLVCLWLYNHVIISIYSGVNSRVEAFLLFLWIEKWSVCNQEGFLWGWKSPTAFSFSCKTKLNVTLSLRIAERRLVWSSERLSSSWAVWSAEQLFLVVTQGKKKEKKKTGYFPK